MPGEKINARGAVGFFGKKICAGPARLAVASKIANEINVYAVLAVDMRENAWLICVCHMPPTPASAWRSLHG